MFEIIDNLMQSPNALLIIQEVQNRIATEAEKRKEFYNLIHEDTKAEFINGEIIFHSPVRNRHWVACTNLAAYLTIHVNTHKIGRVGVEKVMIRCTRNDYEPDIVFFKPETAAKFSAEQLIFPPPDLAIEILSDSTRKMDYGIKFIDYAAHGITEYWIIDADNQTVEQYILKHSEYVLEQKLAVSGTIKSFVVTNFSLEISKIFE